MAASIPVTVAYGDGIGPEIMQAVLRILAAAGGEIAPEVIDIGEQAYLNGHSAGIAPEAWASLRRTGVFLKAPITIPEGGGFRSFNVTARQTLGLYANVRPCVAYDPFVETMHPQMDVVIVRENEEDLYTGIEYRASAEEAQALKVISRPACEKIVSYAFEYARLHGRKKVACFTKDNVLKMSDGLFHKVFEEVAEGYPGIAAEHWKVDLGAAKLADTPGAFDVIVLPNLYGDILSEMAAEVAGSVGLAGAANIGDKCAMFEAVHGSSPRRGGQNLANPSGLLLAAVLMLVHIGRPEAAARVHNAWLRTIEDGVHTYDIFDPAVSKEKVGTREFADAVIARLGQQPCTLKPAAYTPAGERKSGGRAVMERAAPAVELAGVDVYLDFPPKNTTQLVEALRKVDAGPLALAMISNRGLLLWPGGQPGAFCTDVFRCRFAAQPGAVTQQDVFALLGRIGAAGLTIGMAQMLRNFDGEPGYTKAEGE